MRRCRSSPSLLSLSDAEPSSKVSANVLSASEVMGSSGDSRCRDESDDARDRKDGGGDEGTVCEALCPSEVEAVSSESFSETCCESVLWTSDALLQGPCLNGWLMLAGILTRS